MDFSHYATIIKAQETVTRQHKCVLTDDSVHSNGREEYRTTNGCQREGGQPAASCCSFPVLSQLKQILSRDGHEFENKMKICLKI